MSTLKSEFPMFLSIHSLTEAMNLQSKVLVQLTGLFFIFKCCLNLTEQSTICMYVFDRGEINFVLWRWLFLPGK